jgi:hypothetical protein
MKFSKAKLIPLVLRLGDYLKEGFEHYVALKSSGVDVDADIISLFVAEQMSEWNPTISGKELLDSETKQAAAKFVGGVAYNLSK